MIGHAPGRRLRIASLGAVLALVGAACSGTATTPSPASQPPGTPATTGAASEPPGDPLAEACEAGAAEGKVIYWNNHSDNVGAVHEAFTAKYPDIQVESLNLSPDDSAQRILTEASAGRQISTDVAAGGLDVFKPLLDQGIIATDVDWAAMGAPEDVIHELGILRIHRVALGIVYNTDKFTADDLPNTWEELIDAKWRARVVVDPRGRPFDSLGLAWGEEKTLDYVQRLKDTVAPLVIEGGTAGMLAVAGGQADITTGGRSAETLEQQAAGAPLEIKYLDTVSTIDNYNVVIENSAHPNAARCFVGWFATEGQAVYNEVEFKSNDSVPQGAPEGAEVVVIESPEDADAVGELSEQIGHIWTGA